MTFIEVFLMFFPVGLFFAGMFTISLKGFKRFLVVLAISISITGLVSGMLFLEKKQDDSAWNGGICPSCSSEWRLVNVDHLRHGSTIYYYTCDNCGKVIETNHSMRG